MPRSAMETHPQPPSGILAGPCHLFPVRVCFEDTDLTGFAYHANFLKWAERARSDLLRLLGIDQRAAMAAGEGHYAVAEAHVRYLAPAGMDDALTVATTLAELRNASLRLNQRIARGTDLLAEIAVRVGFVGLNGRPRRQPAEWRAAFETFAAKGAE